jgi:hypothetical protein
VVISNVPLFANVKLGTTCNNLQHTEHVAIHVIVYDNISSVVVQPNDGFPSYIVGLLDHELVITCVLYMMGPYFFTTSAVGVK